MGSVRVHAQPNRRRAAWERACFCVKPGMSGLRSGPRTPLTYLEGTKRKKKSKNLKALATDVLCSHLGSRYVFGDDMDAITRSNFGTMGRAALTVFQLFTGDSWSSVMYSALDSGDDALHWIIAALFILSWVILSQVTQAVGTWSRKRGDGCASVRSWLRDGWLEGGAGCLIGDGWFEMGTGWVMRDRMCIWMGDGESKLKSGALLAEH